MMKLSLLLLTAAFMMGIGLAGLVSWNIGYLYIVTALVLGAVIFQLWMNGKRSVMCLVLLFCLLGMVRFMQDDELPPTDCSQYIGQHVSLSGQIADTPKITLTDGVKKIRYIIAVEQLQTSGQVINGTGKLMVSVRQAADTGTGTIGDQIEVTGTIDGLHGYNNPGAVDSVAALKRQGITARMTVSSDSIHIQPALKLTAKKLADRWRSRLSEIFQQTMPASDAAILTGVLFGGGYDTIDAQVLQEFSATGIIHILSVSGSHIALVAAVMLWLGERGRIRSELAVLLTGSMILLYAFLAGLTPPVIRSAIMGVAGLFGLLAGRESSGPNVLALAALIMLAWQPALLYDISFQLSFGATAGLVFFYPKTAAKLNFLPRWLASALAVTFAAQAGIIPFLAWYFHSFSLSSFIANILVIPVIELVIILGLLACVCSPVLPLAAKVLLVVCSLGTGLAVQLNRTIAVAAGLQLYLPPFGLMEGILYYLFLTWCYGYLSSCLPPPAAVLVRWPYRAASVILTVCLLISVLWHTQTVAVHFIDVGQGDATLFISPHGKAILVDTGGTTGENSSFDIGERVVVPYLKHQGITKLDFLILTHGHRDHAGGAAAIAAAIPVSNCIVAPEAFSDSLQALLRKKDHGVLIPAARGQTIKLDGLEIEVVHAGAGTGRGGNESSSVIRVSYGQHSFLITGDIENRQEEEVVANGLTPCTVLKVAHHGSRTSTSDAFLQKAAPSYAVISVGYQNRFGHPHKEILHKLEQANVRTYRTDVSGAVLMKTNGTDLFIEPYVQSVTYRRP